MRFENFTPFATMRYANEDVEQRLFDVVFVKASYGFGENGKLYPLKEQKFPYLTDECFGSVNMTSLRYPSDLVPYKPCSDIILHATTFSPSGKPELEWTCGVCVHGPEKFSRELAVTGPRQWHPSWRGDIEQDEPVVLGSQKGFKSWNLSKPEPIQALKLDYSLAYGGSNPEDDTGRQTVDHRNPLGTGWIVQDLTDHRFCVPAPQILFCEQKLTDPYEVLEPAGFGPIPPAWLPRRPLGGTYDQNWLDGVSPHWPLDYSFAYHNSAPQHMQYYDYLKGDETITLSNIGRSGQNVITLPGDKIFTQQVGFDGNTRFVAMALDTVLIDLWSESVNDWFVSLTWRQVFLEDTLRQLNIDLAAPGKSSVLDETDNGLMPSPHPDDLFYATKGGVV